MLEECFIENELLENSNFIMYTTDDGQVEIEVRLEDENVWLTQKAMSELFDTTRNNITIHIKNIFEENELEENSVSKESLLTASDGKNYKTKYYNLDAIIAVGNRINSKKATEFRIWATKILKEYMTKGFALNDERLKNNGTSPYFEELLARIRDIRSSEKVFWRKVLDIYATSIDYNPKDKLSIDFFKTVQNKLHYSVSGKTAAEIIYHRADSTKEHMGLTTWKRAPEGRIHSTDVVIAKNYLDEEELTSLKNVVNLFLDFAEDMAKRHIPLTMNDYVRRLDILLELSGRKVLNNAGSISHEVAEKFALSEFEKYKLIQESKIINHFDLYIENPKLFELPNMNNKYKDELKEFINEEVVVYVDRPINSAHPKYNDIIYPLNYGYIKEIKTPDGEYQDAYILGINKKVDSFRGIVIAIIERLDDNEFKLVVVPNGLEYTDEEIE